MKTKILIISILSLVFAANSYAEWTDDPKIKKSAISFEPLYLFNNGLKINYERQIANPRQWLEFSTTGYFSSKSLDNNLSTLWFYPNYNYDYYYYYIGYQGYDITDNWGMTLEAAYKYYPVSFMYISSSISYAHHEVAYTGHSMIFDSYTEGGLTYYEPTYSYYEEWKPFDRLGLNFKVGIETSLRQNALIGGYFGWGLIHSFYSEEGLTPQKTICSVSYSGITLQIGFKIGFRF
jgi:hypothetical protein